MTVVTTDFVSGQEIETLGIVRGTMIQAKHIGRDIGSALKTIIGGELRGYTEMMGEARDIATERMVAEARSLGADAVVSVRFSTSAIMAGAAEVLAYGTAVRFIGAGAGSRVR